ncbi:MAG TPA: DUF2785 domain-containing protein [Hyphomonadaceae bacterium]|jgi:hypothetical protein|nr:DUF2785 domain-containing protein [Hyphomonadaceae bacterium]
MKKILALSIGLALAACSPRAADAPGAPETKTAAGAPETCIPAGKTRADLDALKAAGFEIAEDAERQAFAKAITACLGSADPGLRDGIAYEALTHMLRGKQLTTDTMKTLLVDLEAKLEAPEGQGFIRPFAALALSEVARADRIEAFLSNEDLIGLVEKAQNFLINVQDYRGFDPKEGWRHGVAHGSDLLMQLVLNKRIDVEAVDLMLSAIKVQVAPRTHFYVNGESERLARPVLFAASRGALTEAEWSDWLLLLATPPPEIADKVFASNEGLAWKHNTAGFLQALYVNVTLGSDKADDVMIKGLDAALKALP